MNQVVASGKTKTLTRRENVGGIGVFDVGNFITKQDGKIRHSIPGIGAINTAITGACFTVLEAAGIPTHFIGTVSENEFSVHIAEKMIPAEIVVRGVSYGSYRDRNPVGVPEGEFFESPIVECFYKDDERHDPFIVFDNEDDPKFMYLYDAHKPIVDANRIDIIELNADERAMYRHIAAAKVLAVRSFTVLKRQWKLHSNTTLVDAKFEFGILVGGKLALADVVDNDSWRIWPNGDPAQEKSKEVYRRAGKVTQKVLDKVLANYQWVEKQVAQFR